MTLTERLESMVNRMMVADGFEHTGTLGHSALWSHQDGEMVAETTVYSDGEVTISVREVSL